MSKQYAYRGANIEVHLGVLWEAYVYMPGSILAEPVGFYSCLEAGVEDVVARAHELVDQRVTAAMTIMMRHNELSRAAAS